MSIVQKAIRNWVAPLIAEALAPVVARVAALEQRVSVLTAAEQAALAAAVSLVAEFDAGASTDESVTVTDVRG